jgi:hypothetical protein
MIRIQKVKLDISLPNATENKNSIELIYISYFVYHLFAHLTFLKLKLYA